MRRAIILQATSIVILLIVGVFVTQAQTPAGESTATVKGITPGRARTLIAGGVAIAALIAAVIARKRAGKGENVRVLATISVLLAGVSIVFSIIHLVNTSGAVFGSGSGKAGAIVALLVALPAFFIALSARRVR